LAGRGRIDEAAAQFQAVLNTRPDHPEAHNNLGALLAGQGRMDEAIAHFRKAVELKPTYAEAYKNLGSALADRGKTGEAMEQWRKALALAEQQGKAGLAADLKARLRANEGKAPRPGPRQPLLP
jgi:Flp pilus assembly protein TadD